MHIEATGTAKIRHIVTGEIYEIEASELEWDSTSGHERQMGVETTWDAVVSHPVLGDLTWVLWEYPSGAMNDQSQSLNGHELVENFQFYLEDEQDGPEDDDDDEATPVERYYTDEDDHGKTPGQLRALKSDTQVEYLTHWFFSYYEDPSQSTPYNGREGGFQYIYGGPFNAAEEISGEFGSYVSESVIDRAVEIVEADGISDWAPHPNHPSRLDEGLDDEFEEPFAEGSVFEQKLDLIFAALESGTPARFGSVGELALRSEVKDAIDDLERALVPQQIAFGGIGHNGAPPDEVLLKGKSKEISESVAVVKHEIAKAEPNAKEVAGATKVLYGVLKECSRLLGLSAEEFAKSFGKTAGESLGKHVGPAFTLGGAYLTGVIEKTFNWLDLITNLF